MRLRVISRYVVVILFGLALVFVAKWVLSSDSEQQRSDVRSAILSVANSLGYTMATIDGEKRTVIFTSDRGGIAKTIRIVFLEDGKTMNISAKVTGGSGTVCRNLSVRIVEEFIQGLSDRLGGPRIEQGSSN